MSCFEKGLERETPANGEVSDEKRLDGDSKTIQKRSRDPVARARYIDRSITRREAFWL